MSPAHSEQMKGRAIGRARGKRPPVCSDAALTMALLGMWQIDSILLPRLSGLFEWARTAPAPNVRAGTIYVFSGLS